MSPVPDPIEDALATTDAAGMERALGAVRPILSVADATRLGRRLASFAESRRPLRLALLRTYATEMLRPFWTFEALLNGFELSLHEAPFGQIVQEAEPSSSTASFAPDVTVLCLRAEDLAPELAVPIMAMSDSDRAAAGEGLAASLSAMVERLRANLPGTIVVTLLPRMFGPELGRYDISLDHGEQAFRMSLKQRVVGALRDLPAVHFEDLDQAIEEIGRRGFFDHRLWHAARYPFAVGGANLLTRRLMVAARLSVEPPAKCIVLDADNTLWGGVVGEDGIDGIALGPDHPGSIHHEFQTRLLALQQRGLILALCSKNNEADVLEVLREHPRQVLRERHFAAMRVNWEPKSANLRALAEELNLGLDSFVFIDDSAHECHEVRQALPRVSVWQVPQALHELPRMLDEMARLQVLTLTAEDRKRTRLYAQEGARRALRSSARSTEDYLASLKMMMTVGFDDRRHVARISQLTGKTNQFNLTTKRYDEAAIARFMDARDGMVAHFSLADIFGDSGLVGVAIVTGLAERQATLDSFLMSCRVIGRQAEAAFMAAVLARLAELGVHGLHARFVPTAKNGLVKDLLPRLGFAPAGETGAYVIATDRPPAAPAVGVTIELHDKPKVMVAAQ